MVGHLAVIHAAAGQPVPVGYLANPFWIAAQEGEQLGNFGKDIFGDVAAAGARISDELLLVELLRYLQCLLRREAVLGVGFLLQGGEVVEQRRFLHLLLALHLGDKQGGLRFYLIIYMLRRGFLLPFLQRRELHRLFPCAFHRQMHLPKGFGCEALVLPVAGAHHGQRGCLHTSEGVGAPACGDGHGLRGVDAYQPVGLTACLGGMVEAVVAAALFEVAQPLADGLVGEGADPEAYEGRAAVQVAVEVAEDEFALASGIGGHYNLFALAEEPAHDAYLRDDAGFGLVALLRLGVTGLQGEGVGQDGQVLTGEAVDAVPFGHGELHEVPVGPGDGIAVAGKITFFSLARAHDAGYLTCHGGLLCDNRLHTDLLFSVFTYCFYSHVWDNCGFSGGTQAHTFMPLLLRFSCFC